MKVLDINGLAKTVQQPYASCRLTISCKKNNAFKCSHYRKTEKVKCLKFDLEIEVQEHWQFCWWLPNVPLSTWKGMPKYMFLSSVVTEHWQNIDIFKLSQRTMTIWIKIGRQTNFLCQHGKNPVENGTSSSSCLFTVHFMVKTRIDVRTYGCPHCFMTLHHWNEVKTDRNNICIIWFWQTLKIYIAGHIY